jgi:hypothetical protein
MGGPPPPQSWKSPFFEDLGDRTKLTQTMRFVTTEDRDTTMQYGVEEGAKGGFGARGRAAAAAAGDTMSMATRTARKPAQEGDER